MGLKGLELVRKIILAVLVGVRQRIFHAPMEREVIGFASSEVGAHTEEAEEALQRFPESGEG